MSKSRSVLIVDDTAFIRVMLRAILNSEGYVIQEAVNGRDAIEKYFEHRPDCVLMDIVMPKMNGLAALRAIREKDPAARVIMVSALTEPRIVEEALHCGAVSYIAKPFQPMQIKEAVRACLS